MQLIHVEDLNRTKSGLFVLKNLQCNDELPLSSYRNRLHLPLGTVILGKVFSRKFKISSERTKG